MNEQESYAEMVKVTVGIFKEDVENNLCHMNEVLRLSAPPFIHELRRDIVEATEASQAGSNQSAGEANEASKEVESLHRQ